MESHYGKSSIVFGGNQDGPSTKDRDHAQRIMKSKKSPEVSIILENPIGDISQQAFLTKRNSKCFIDLLVRPFPSNGHVLQCRGDVDTSIVSILDFACAGENVCLIAADTDLLIMLIYMWNYMMGQIKMQREGTRKHKVSVRDIGKITSTLGDI